VKTLSPVLTVPPAAATYIAGTKSAVAFGISLFITLPFTPLPPSLLDQALSRIKEQMDIFTIVIGFARKKTNLCVFIFYIVPFNSQFSNGSNITWT
jgi:hypothetical protein